MRQCVFLFLFCLMQAACGSGVAPPHRFEVARPAEPYHPARNAAAEKTVEAKADVEIPDYANRKWEPLSVERVKHFLKERGAQLAGNHVPKVSEQTAANLENRLRDRDLALVLLVLMSSEYRYISHAEFAKIESEIINHAISDTAALSHEDAQDFELSAELFSNATRAKELVYAGRLVLARIFSQEISIENGRLLMNDILLESKALEQSFNETARQFGPDDVHGLITYSESENAFFASLRSIEYYAELTASESPCRETYYSDELLEWIWDTWGPEHKGSLCNKGYGHSSQHLLDSSNLADLNRSDDAMRNLRIPKSKNSTRAVSSIQRWNGGIVVSMKGREDRFSFAMLDETTLHLTPISIRGSTEKIQSLSENDRELFALIKADDGYALARKLRSGGNWVLEKLPECGGEDNPCQLTAGQSHVFVLDRNTIMFRTPKGVWVGVPMTRFFGDRSLRGRVTAAVVQGDNLFLGYNRGEFGGGLVRLQLSDNPNHPIMRGEFLRQILVDDIVATDDGSVWIISNNARMQHFALFCYKDGKLETIFNQSFAFKSDEKPERYFVSDPEPRFYLPAQGILADIAGGGEGGVYFLFPMPGIIELKNDKLEFVVALSIEGNAKFARYDRDLFLNNLMALPSGDFLIGTSAGLLLLQKKSGRWTYRRLTPP